MMSANMNEFAAGDTAHEKKQAFSEDLGPVLKQETIVEFKQVPDSAVDGENISSSESGSSITDLFNSFHQLHKNIGTFIDNNKFILRCIFIGLTCSCALGYFVWALVISIKYHCQDIRALIGLVVVIVLCVMIWFIKTHFSTQLEKWSECAGAVINGKVRKLMKVAVCLSALAGITVVTLLTAWRRPSNLVALAGLLFFVIFLWLFSAHPGQVKWRPVLGGFCIQFYFAVIILRWDFGYNVFHWLGQRVQEFLAFTNFGAEFVFGPKYTDHIFAMKVLPVVVFFSCAINVLYYIGAMQMIISKIGWLLRKVLGTTAPESLCAAANIFIGQSEAPIMIRPFMPLMTKSELNAVMTGGFATIAGGVMAAYISFGVPPEHLLCASVMNAPCALAVSKLLYPETETSQIRKLSDVDLGERKERNILEAAAAGASASIKLVANIAANLIAFLAMLAFVNAMLSWFGSFLCHPELSFQMICSYVFMPIAYMMGVQWSDAGVVGELVGIKTFLNEFVAYKELSKFMENRLACTGELISMRSQVIATYALCGFSNLSSIGIQLGALGPMAPERRGDLATIVLRSLLGGIVTCLITASIAGLLLVDEPLDLCISGANNTINMNVTMATVVDSIIGDSNNVTYLTNSTAGSVL
ncbi:solute carrier family 28 member 3-like [Mercenaria mercenaria]|uniref:solute carrier family 28 member 3-like n=1 Tax=Mercenaria mercenaria TaxID=6596 RepID=UPI00234EBD9D|nr:solute carrier family 28 member 3-like [Mercenaria mercenaria]